jgi:hypothetical protein
MLGYHTDMVPGVNTPATFANFMLPSYLPRNIVLQMPIASAWIAASSQTQSAFPLTIAAAMGPIDQNGISDIHDYYGRRGPIGPSIPQSNIAGWWYLYVNGAVITN